jgi:trans-2,3-dihydro-3-hydroxyanthranilate isomerase
MKLRFHTLDVFTANRFGGNQLAVVHEADALSEPQMQAIAGEFNLPETIFVRRPADAANTASVRIFTPKAQLPFAGHPVVGCAILLASLKHKDGCNFESEIRLEAVAGLVPLKVTRIGPTPRAIFTTPVLAAPVAGPIPTPAAAAAGLGLAEGDIGFGDHAITHLKGGPSFFFVPIASWAALARAQPLEPHWTQAFDPASVGAYLYAKGGDAPMTSFRARMFAPRAGIIEDPATGSATAVFAQQLLTFEKLGPGTHSFELEQGFEMGRPSHLHLEADVAGGKLAAVRVAGQAVQIAEGMLEV